MATNITNSNIKTEVFVLNGTQWMQLDLLPFDPIKITLSAYDVEQGGSNVADYTQTFRLPNTSNNAQFFTTAFSVNGNSFNASLVIPTYINMLGNYFRSGNIHLTNIYNNYEQVTTEYEVLFVGSTSAFSTVIGGLFLSDLNFGPDYVIGATSYKGNDLTHDLIYTSIINSWGANNIESGVGASGLSTPNGHLGDVIYPLVEWGYDYDSNNYPTDNTVSIDTLPGAKSFTNTPVTSPAGTYFNYHLNDTGNPYAKCQLKPAARIKAIWDAIFNGGNFTYDSDFLTSSDFLQMYMLSDSVARNGYNTARNFTTATSTQTLNPGFSYINVATVLYGNNIDADGYFVVPETSGVYLFEAVSETNYLPLTSGGSPNPNTIAVNWGATVSGNPTVTIGLYDSFGNNIQAAGRDQLYINGQLVYTPSFFSLTQGQRVKLGATCAGGVMSIVPLVWSMTNYPTNVLMNELMPVNRKQIDFIKSISERFKLVWTPDYNNPSNFNIEPWVTWIINGNVIDWTSNLVEEKDFIMSPLFYTQKRIQELTDSSDQDMVNFNYQQIWKYPFGYKLIDSNIQLITETQKTDSLFAPTPLNTIGGINAPGTNGIGATNCWMISHLGKLTIGSNTNSGSIPNKIEPMVPIPRLIYWNGTQSNPPGVSWWLYDNVGATVTQHYNYPQVTPFNNWTQGIGVSGATAKDLNWINTAPYYNQALYNANSITSNDIYNTYWNTWVNCFYDPYARKCTAYFKLSPDDILNLRFNNRYWIKDAYYFVTKVYDYIVGEVSLCKVDLIKINNFGV